MNDLKNKSLKLSAKLGLTVPLFVVLAACSSKSVQNSQDELVPIAANEVPAPLADAQPLPSKQSSVKKHRQNKKVRSHVAVNSRRAKKKSLKTAQAQVQNSRPSPPAPLPPAEVAKEILTPLPPVMVAAEATQPSPHRAWWIAGLGLFALLALGMGYRYNQARKPRRRLQFNSMA